VKEEDTILPGDSGFRCEINSSTGERPACITGHCCGSGKAVRATYNAEEVETCQKDSTTQFWHKNEFGGI